MSGRYEIHEEDLGSGWCSMCGEECSESWQDMGIGRYEFWGGRYNDVRWEIVSECCGSEVVSEKPENEEEETEDDR